MKRTQERGEHGAEAPEGEGWEPRSILDEPRLSEVVEEYLRLGLDVKVMTLTPGLALECSVCLEGQEGRYKVVYTRPGNGDTADEADELYD